MTVITVLWRVHLKKNYCNGELGKDLTAASSPTTILSVAKHI